MKDEGTTFLRNEILATCKKPVPMDEIVRNVTNELPRHNHITDSYIRNTVWYLMDCGEIELNTDRLFVAIKNVSK